MKTIKNILIIGLLGLTIGCSRWDEGTFTASGSVVETRPVIFKNTVTADEAISADKTMFTGWTNCWIALQGSKPDATNMVFVIGTNQYNFPE